MKHKAVEKLYTEKASLYYWVFIKFFQYENGLRNFFKTNQYLRQNDKVLDAGCGSGVLIKVLYRVAKTHKLKGIRFHGFDLTQAMLDMFIKWIDIEKPNNITLKKANVLKLDDQLPDDWKNYDLIVSSAMLEYIPKSEVEKALHNLSKLMKEDGIFCLFITKKNFLMSLLIKWWWKANIYEKEEIRDKLKDAGFNDIRFRKFQFPYNYINCWGFAIEAKK
jgi:cyclopropane fatty-acyl-phospholipid synthase-like methyltransferase